jgi:lipopolysaccharide transport system permease protein
MPTQAIEQSPRIPHFSIRPRRGWQVINFAELVAYRDLFYFLVWRDMKVRYAQSILGVGWAIIQPLFNTGLFTLIFNRFAGMKAPDGMPYELFSFAATVPWAFFSNSLSEASGSLVGGAHMISKVYFPRLILPMTAVLGKLVDFAIALVLLFIAMAFYRRMPTPYVAMLPVLVVLMMMSASGLGMLLTALAIQYRDVRYAMSFAVSLLMYASPVIYSTSVVPVKLQWLYALNPMVGVIEGFRAALLGGQPMPWDLIGISAAVSTVCLVVGALYFRRMERVFADVA